MRDIYIKLTEMHKKGRLSVLATIIKQAGPSPRGIGTKCLILEDGSIVGTIGGGLLEARVLEEAKEIFSTRLPKRLSRLTDHRPAAQSGLTTGCSGGSATRLAPEPERRPSEQTRLRNLDNYQLKSRISENAEAQTWKSELGSLGSRTRLHGNELRLRSGWR